MAHVDPHTRPQTQKASVEFRRGSHDFWPKIERNSENTMQYALLFMPLERREFMSAK